MYLTTILFNPKKISYKTNFLRGPITQILYILVINCRHKKTLQKSASSTWVFEQFRILIPAFWLALKKCLLNISCVYMYREKEYNKEFSIYYFRLAVASIINFFRRHWRKNNNYLMNWQIIEKCWGIPYRPSHFSRL